MNTPLAAYSRFLPQRVIARHRLDPRVPGGLHAEVLRGAVLMADITGYTALTERYSQWPEGIEQLQTQLNDFFGRLNSVIAGWGGDIISFAGDSVLAVWPEAGGLAAADAAARCALEAQRTLDRSDLGESLQLRMRIVVAAGDCTVATVGGADGKWACVATGTAVGSLARGMDIAQPGGVVLDAEAQHQLAVGADLTLLSDGYAALLRLQVPAVLPEVELLSAGTELTAALRAYIAAPVLAQLDAGQFEWLSEFRRVSTVFIRIGGIDFAGTDGIARLHGATQIVQAAVARSEGGFQRVIVDDKGSNVLCVWGVPGRAHEDDPARAVNTALAIHASLQAAGFDAGIGITTGRVMCGPMGGGCRFEYTVVGEAVNLAARLMVAAGTGVLCDAPTAEAAAGACLFASVEAVTVKGRAGRVAVCQPRAGVPAGTTEDADNAPRSRFFGRIAELDRLRSGLQAARAGHGGLVLIDGEPGVGKSQLVAAFQRETAGSGVTFLVGQADAIEHGTTYFIWRAILRRILAEAGASGSTEQRHLLETMFVRERVLAGWLPLLNDVLPLGFVESAAIRAMSEQARAESTLQVLLHLLQAALGDRPTVLVLEDAHWMDSVSWTLAARLLQHAQHVLMVLAMRSGYAPESDEGRALLAQTAAQRISLAAFSREDTEALVCDRLGADSVPAALIKLIYERTDGHPLFSEELAYSLRDSGYLLMRGRQCVLAGNALGIDAAKMPVTVEGIIASRVDRLGSGEQFTLKIASVLGRGFARRTLSAVHPLGTSEAEINRQLERFVALDLVHTRKTGDGNDYQFKHIITQEVTYGLLSFAQRRDLHRAAGGWLEDAHAADLSEVYPLLAHHWSRAADASRAFHYLHKAGEQAFHRYANREAAQFLDEARQLKFPSGAQPARIERASCERLLGFSWLWLGHIERSTPHIHRSLEMLDCHIPVTRLQLTLGNVYQLVLAAGNHLSGNLFVPRDARAMARRGEIVESLIRYGHIAWFRADVALNFYVALRILNLARRAEDSAETALIYAVLTSAAGAIPLHRLARRYRDFALEALPAAGEQGIRSQVLLFLTLYEGGIGEWEHCIARLSEGEQLARAIGDLRRAEEHMVITGYMRLHTGDIAAARQCYAAAAESAHWRGDRQTTSWGLLGTARVELACGHAEPALLALAQAAPFITDSLGGIELHGMYALAHLRTAQFEQAWQSARTGLGILRAARPVSFTALTGTAGVAESLIALWMHARLGVSVDRPDVIEREARRALGLLQRFANIFPVARPAYLLQEGYCWHVSGKPTRALACWQRSSEAAAALSMPRDEALAWQALARYAEGSLATVAHARAAALFETLGVAQPAPLLPA